MRRFLFILLSALALAAPLAHAEMPITTDSRIKTFVYNPNEVYTITTHYGYQSNIEFGEKESIDTVSIGDRVAWQIIPAGRRMFIRAMEENAHTNMTIVTNLRAYQFDLRSSSADATFGSEELTYVVRFFYPGDGGMMPTAASYTPGPMAVPSPTGSLPMPAAAPSFQPAPPLADINAAPPPPRPVTTTRPVAPTPYAPVSSAAPAASNPSYNYRYTYSGPNNAAPVKIYDDGKSTYFKYRSATMPKVAVITARGEQLDVPVRNVGGNVVAVDIVAPRFSLNQSGGQVIVYNEANG
jgi:type IV secretion system protein VirB9